MPVIKTFDEIRIYIFPEDHLPPHVHVFQGGQEVSIQIGTLTVTGKMHTRILRKAVKWLEENQDMLIAEWERING